MMQFSNYQEMLDYAASLSHIQKRKILKAYGYNMEEIVQQPYHKIELRADYLIFALHKGLTGQKAIQFANTKTESLVHILPHLGKETKMEAKAEKREQKRVNTNTVKTKAIKVSGKNKVKHPDFTIVYRADRKGFEGWHSGRAEAFRPTAEKVSAFLMKKYGVAGKIAE